MKKSCSFYNTADLWIDHSLQSFLGQLPHSGQIRVWRQTADKYDDLFGTPQHLLDWDLLRLLCHLVWIQGLSNVQTGQDRLKDAISQSGRVPALWLRVRILEMKLGCQLGQFSSMVVEAGTLYEGELRNSPNNSLLNRLYEASQPLCCSKPPKVCKYSFLPKEEDSRQEGWRSLSSSDTGKKII